MNDLKIYLSVLLVFFYFLVSNPVSAQVIPKNLSNINIDDLSDAQILQLLQKAQQMGLSDSQIVQLAQSKGMSDSEIQKLQSRLADIHKQNTNVNSTNTIQPSRKLNSAPETDSESKKINPDEFFEVLRPRIFGADLFRNNNSNTFQPNLRLATPMNYIVGPDDQININVYGNSLADWSLTVSPEGNINIPGVGVVSVSGKTISEVTVIVKNRLAANNYLIGKGTNVKVSLGDIRSISVILQGQVVKPGTYTLPSLATVFNALYAAGGPNDVGSFRQIEVIRDSKVIKRVDLYDFLVHGSQKDNIALRDQDVIHVPAYNTRVEIKGEVKIPALFETLPGEKLQNMINFSGGFSDEAYTLRVKIDQVSDQQRKIVYVYEKDYKNYVPLRGDRFTVDRILNRYENRVKIEGAVFRPGEYELQKGLTLSQLIKNAGGVKEDAFMDRGSIVRLKADNTTLQLSFSIKRVLSNPDADIELKREDSILISSVFNLRDSYKVSIKGEIRNPGSYAFSDSMKVADVILKAGGFKEGASGKRIEVSRRVFNNDPYALFTKTAHVFSVDIDAGLKLDGANFTLMPYDIISVYGLPGYEIQKIVKVEGEVLYPGYYTIQNKNERISDIIKRAGGVIRSADREGASLKRNNAAVLGVDKTKIDTSELFDQRSENFSRLQSEYYASSSSGGNTINNKALNEVLKKDSVLQPRNSYVGINLEKILKNPGSSEDLIVSNEDVIRVPKLQQTVRVNGEVMYPSAIVYERGKSFKDYVISAGGYSPNGLKKGAYIVYPNGEVKGTRKVLLFFNNNPSVKPGSEIYVPRKPESKSPQEVMAYTTSLISLGAILLGVFTLIKK